MAQKFEDLNKLTCWKSFIENFPKKVLKLRPSIPNCMIYGEVGKLPLQTSVEKQLIAYWLRVLNKDVHTFAYMVYMIALNLFRRNEYKSQWLKKSQIYSYILYLYQSV